LVRKPEGKTLFARLRPTCKDNFEADLKKSRVSMWGLDSLYLGYEPVAGSYEISNGPSGFTKSRQFLD
jgi:hypothetical protein